MGVLRQGLIQIARQQRVINQVAANGGRAAQDEGVETVKRPDGGQRDFAALWRVGVHPGPMGEIRRQGGLPQQGHCMGAHDLTGPVAPGGIGGAGADGQAGKSGAKRQKVTTLHRLQDGVSKRLGQWRSVSAL